MIKTISNKSPRISPSACIAENASIIGSVSVGADSSIWYGAVLRGDYAPILIGEKTNVQDLCVLHVSPNRPLVLEDHVVVGHGALLHSCIVESNCLIGSGAILLDGCHIGAGSVVAAGCLIPAGTVIPSESLVMGSPGKIVRQVSPDEISAHKRGAEEYSEMARQHFSPATHQSP